MSVRAFTKASTLADIYHANCIAIISQESRFRQTAQALIVSATVIVLNTGSTTEEQPKHSDMVKMPTGIYISNY